MTTQDSKKILKQKHELDEEKAEFTEFARSQSGHTEMEVGQEFANDREPDNQNRMKSVENRRSSR